MGEMHFLAETYVTAAKYQVKSLEDKTYDEMKDLISTKADLRLYDTGCVDDFLNALGTVVAGTTQQNHCMRALMVDCCFWNLPALTDTGTKFSDFLSNNAVLAAEIIARLKTTTSPFEGSWYCDGERHPGANPGCPSCETSFTKRYMLMFRNDGHWQCYQCGMKSRPVCLAEDCGDGVTNRYVEWEWEEEEDCEDQGARVLEEM